MDVDVSSLSDSELSQMLKDYGVDVGPVNMATRKIYERKLQRLKTGDVVVTSTPKYAPLRDDEDNDDDEVQFKHVPVTRQEKKPPSPKPVKTPEPTETRLRRDPANTYTPLIESRPSLNSARKTTLSFDAHKPLTPKEISSANAQGGSGGIPTWVKLLVVFVILVLVFLIYSNMESNVGNIIPKIPNKMEV